MSRIFGYQTYVLFDLGGGSIELVFSLNGIKSQSFPFGIVTTAERYKNSKLMKKVSMP